MPPSLYNLQVYRGDTTIWTVKLWTDASRTTPVDLTGQTPKAELRNAPGGGTIIPTTCTLTLPNTIKITLTAANAKNAVTGVWDLQLTDGSGVVTTMVAGQVTVTPDVTDST